MTSSLGSESAQVWALMQSFVEANSPRAALREQLGAALGSGRGKVKALLVDALSVDDEEITPQARLQADLNAESIDFLDIVFRLEREFGLKIDRNDLFPDSIFQGDPKFVQNGMLTPDGLVELKSKMPYADISNFAANPKFDQIGDLFTVDLITRYIHSRLNSK